MMCTVVEPGWGRRHVGRLGVGCEIAPPGEVGRGLLHGQLSRRGVAISGEGWPSRRALRSTYGQPGVADGADGPADDRGGYHS